MQVLMVGALPKWRDDGHLSSVESQLPYVFVNLDARRQDLRGRQRQVRAGSAIRNHLRRHRAADDCRLHRIPTGRFPSPVTTPPGPARPARNATTGTAPSGGRHPDRVRNNPLAENRPTKTTAHAVRTPTGMRHRSPPRSSPIDAGLLRSRTRVRVEQSRCGQHSIRRRVQVRVRGRVLRGHPRRRVHDMGNETVTA